MSVAVKSVPDLTAPAGVLPPTGRLYRFTVEQYERLIDAGVFNGEGRVELLEGWIVAKMTHNPPHDGTVNRMNRRLTRLLSDEWAVRVQSSVRLAHSQPEPDLVIARGPDDVYLTRHPAPRDIAILIEVADSSLLYDRETKGAVYAQARIPEYWVVNLAEARIEVYTGPRAGKAPAYRHRRDYGPEEQIPLVLGGREVAQLAVGDLLP